MKKFNLKGSVQSIFNKVKKNFVKDKVLQENTVNIVNDEENLNTIQESKQETTRNTNTDNDGLFDIRPNGDKVLYRCDGKTIWCIDKANGDKELYRDDGTIIWRIEKASKCKVVYQKDGKTIKYIKKPSGEIVKPD